MMAFDPHSYKPGDELFVTRWGICPIGVFTVVKVTPSGQVAAECGEKKIRINKRGTLIGGASGWSLSESGRYAEINSAYRRHNLLSDIRSAAEAILAGASHKDVPGIETGAAAVAKALAALKEHDAGAGIGGRS